MKVVRLADHQATGLMTPGEFLSRYPDGVPDALRLMGVDKLQAATKGKGTVVGVVDTGIAPHPDLKDKIVGFRDYVSNRTAPYDDNGHGTHVAGTIAADGRLRGVAPEALLRGYKVLDARGQGSYEAITRAIVDATNDGCGIINLSLGGPDYDQKMHDAVKYATGRGTLVVVAVGNEGRDKVSYPGYYPEVVGVGAVLWHVGLKQIVRAWFSNTNKEVDLCTPGVSIVSCAHDSDGYRVLDGTSMASPHAAGYAALKRTLHVDRLGYSPSESQTWSMIKTDTVDIEDLGIDAKTGAGFLCAMPYIPRKRSVRLKLGEHKILIDEIEERIIDAVPHLDPETNRSMLPIRHSHEALGDKVTWDGTILIERWT